MTAGGCNSMIDLTVPTGFTAPSEIIVAAEYFWPELFRGNLSTPSPYSTFWQDYFTTFHRSQDIFSCSVLRHACPFVKTGVWRTRGTCAYDLLKALSPWSSVGAYHPCSNHTGTADAVNDFHDKCSMHDLDPDTDLHFVDLVVGPPNDWSMVEIFLRILHVDKFLEEYRRNRSCPQPLDRSQSNEAHSHIGTSSPDSVQHWN
jgi:hypothetical protein